MKEWIHDGTTFDPDEEYLKDFVGFVYLLTNESTGKMYVGKKFFWATRRLPPLKGKKLRRKKVMQSDWKTYHGSSGDVQRLVEDGEVFTREILHLCTSKGECSYLEAKEQFDRDVLLSDEYYNEFIGCKIHSRHLTKKKISV